MLSITASNRDEVWRFVIAHPFFCDLKRDGNKFRIHLRIGSSNWVSGPGELEEVTEAAYARIQVELVKERLTS